VPGKELDGTFWAMDFLVRSNVPAERLPELMRRPVIAGDRVAVIGGGDTAMDCVRSAVRLGAKEVTCVYRRTEAEMPGRAQERENAREEGVRFHYLARPIRLLGDSNRHVRRLECQKMELGEPRDLAAAPAVPGPGFDRRHSVVFALGFRSTNRLPG
jgi:glutamate synthase (NADPH/NADH) small chain